MSTVRLPSRQRRWPAYVIVAIVLLGLLFTIMSQFYVDLLWFREVGYTSVFWTELRTKLLLGVAFGAVFFAVLYVNLLIVRRIAPTTRFLTPDQEAIERVRQAFEPYLRWLIPVGCAVLALLVAIGVTREWQTFLLWRNSSGVEFGDPEPLFGRDPAFYIFSLPWLKFLQGWLFSALVGITLLTGIAHLLWGGIRPQAPAWSERVTPATRAHLSVLLGLIMLAKAWGYYLGRFDLLGSTRGVVQGASYTDVNAQLPALNFLDDRGVDLRGAVPGEHPGAAVEPPGDRGGAVGAGLGPAGHGLPVVRAAVPRGAAGVPARAGVHRRQHRGDQTGVRDRERRRHHPARRDRT